jgi:hypothetical protein
LALGLRTGIQVARKSVMESQGFQRGEGPATASLAPRRKHGRYREHGRQSQGDENEAYGRH